MPRERPAAREREGLADQVGAVARPRPGSRSARDRPGCSPVQARPRPAAPRRRRPRRSRDGERRAGRARLAELAKQRGERRRARAAAECLRAAGGGLRRRRHRGRPDRQAQLARPRAGRRSVCGWRPHASTSRAAVCRSPAGGRPAGPVAGPAAADRASPTTGHSRSKCGRAGLRLAGEPQRQPAGEPFRLGEAPRPSSAGCARQPVGQLEEPVGDRRRGSRAAARAHHSSGRPSSSAGSAGSRARRRRCPLAAASAGDRTAGRDRAAAAAGTAARAGLDAGSPTCSFSRAGADGPVGAGDPRQHPPRLRRSARPRAAGRAAPRGPAARRSIAVAVEEVRLLVGGEIVLDPARAQQRRGLVAPAGRQQRFGVEDPALAASAARGSRRRRAAPRPPPRSSSASSARACSVPRLGQSGIAGAGTLDRPRTAAGRCSPAARASGHRPRSCGTPRPAAVRSAHVPVAVVGRGESMRRAARRSPVRRPGPALRRARRRAPRSDGAASAHIRPPPAELLRPAHARSYVHPAAPSPRRAAALSARRRPLCFTSTNTLPKTRKAERHVPWLDCGARDAVPQRRARRGRVPGPGRMASGGGHPRVSCRSAPPARARP